MNTLKQKLINSLLDWISEMYLVEMSIERKKLIGNIISLNTKLTDHLFYLLSYPSSLTINHWKNEIINWFDEVGDVTLKPNNKKLDSDTYFKYLYGTKFGDGMEYDMVYKLIKRSEQKEGKLEVKLSDEVIINKFKKLFKQISEYFSKCNVVDHSVLNKYLDEFMK